MNKKIKTCLFMMSLLIATTSCFSEVSKPMNIKKAEKIWGKEKFDIKKFQKGDYKTRSKMAVDLITSKYYEGKPFSDVKKELGNFDGYFENDAVPAYLLTDKNGKVIWQLVFIPDDKWEKVRNVEIRKN